MERADMKSLWVKCLSLSLVVAAGLGGPLAGCGGPDAPDAPGEPAPGAAADEPVELPPSAASQIEALLAEKAARTPAQRKIASQLLYARSGRFADATAGVKDPAKRITSLAPTDARGRVLVDIKGDVEADAITALGGEVVGASRAHQATRAWLPLDQLEALAGRPTVRSIRPALQATTSRIDAPHAAP